MKPWTPEDVASKLHEFIGDVGETDERLATRRRILEVATSHFVRFGYRKASIADIAQDCGLGKGTLYLYFDSKQTLVAACISMEKLVFVDGLRQVMALPLEDRLEAYIRLTLRFVFEAPLSSAIARGDRELKMLIAALPKGQHQESRDKAVALTESFVDPALGLDEAGLRDRITAMLAALPLVAHLVDPDRRLGMDADRFIDSYAQVLAQGILTEKAQ